MRNIFAISLAVIGGAIGFILGMTIGFSVNLTSPMALYSVAAVLALIGGFGLSKVSPFIDSQDVSTQKALTVLCAIIAVILLLMLMVTMTMLTTYFNR
ncbi:hypothetical protein [Entomomonas asaccharolytica]|uniref:Uncharacterized protein n=1 Tax=Entomomonas asaccharolytica TaxID=2785331 RepID=A0A974NEY7_9GAMM|nr:hypothetical protein [Entomomonas asaccharolytica]QQP85541.1 hypothetical protein JHT90_14405 [Entomomonas asaccharolytica]